MRSSQIPCSLINAKSCSVINVSRCSFIFSFNSAGSSSGCGPHPLHRFPQTFSGSIHFSRTSQLPKLTPFIFFIYTFSSNIPTIRARNMFTNLRSLLHRQHNLQRKRMVVHTDSDISAIFLRDHLHAFHSIASSNALSSLLVTGYPLRNSSSPSK